MGGGFARRKAWRKRQQALRSDWLNSYGTVHPMDPNLRRSCVTLRGAHFASHLAHGVAPRRACTEVMHVVARDC